MRSWQEFVDFVRGTRQRPPPGPKRPLVAFLLTLASALHLPIVYLLVRDDTLRPPFIFGVGLLAMGLAWSGGVSLEGRRLGTVRAFCALGVLAAALAFVPSVAAAVGAARWLFVGIALLGAVSLALARR